MVTETDLALDDGRTLHVYDTGTGAGSTGLAVFWQHGTRLGTVAAQALETDRGGMVDDDLALVTPWGCDLREIGTPVLLVHGAQDRLVPSSHATWLARRCRTAELWLRPDDGHVSILDSSVMTLDWLRDNAAGSGGVDEALLHT